MLSVMEENTRRGADMVRQVLLFSRGRDNEKEPVSVGSLVREMERIIRQTFPEDHPRRRARACRSLAGARQLDAIASGPAQSLRQCPRRDAARRRTHARGGQC